MTKASHSPQILVINRLVCVSPHDAGTVGAAQESCDQRVSAGEPLVESNLCFWFPGIERVRCNTMRTEVALVGFSHHMREIDGYRAAVVRFPLRISHSPALPSSAALTDHFRPFVCCFGKTQKRCASSLQKAITSCQERASARTLLQIPSVRDPTTQVPMIAGRCDPCCAQLICACLRGELCDFLTRLVVFFSPCRFS